MSLNTIFVSDIQPLKSVVFVRDMEHGDKITKGGLILLDDDGTDRGIRPRTCVVYKVGRDIDYLEPGDKILVSHGRWTRGVDIDVNGDKFTLHMVDTKDILTIIDD